MTRWHTIAALALFAFGTLGGLEWLRDLWRARNDRAVDRHPRARQREALAHTIDPPTTRAALAERLRRREVVAECEFFDIDAATLGGEPVRPGLTAVVAVVGLAACSASDDARPVAVSTVATTGAYGGFQ